MHGKTARQLRQKAPNGLLAFWAYARRDTAQTEPVRLQMMRRRLARLALRRRPGPAA
jgi:hypothetical protein